jgi:hypothetical protein
MQISRFSPIDDVPEFDSEEFQAGYDARMAGESGCIGATRSWRAGWADADSICDWHEALRMPLLN